MTNKKDKKLLVWAIIASHFAPPFMFAGVAVTLPSIGLELNAGATSLGLIETLFLAGGASFLLPAGRIADATDKNTLFKIGLLGFGVTSILIAMLSSIPVILTVRFLQGVFSAIFSATGPAILADIVPSENRGRAYGSSLGAIYAGLTLGPIGAGFLIDHWGWRSVFWGGALVLILGFLLIQWMLPSSWRRPEKPVHLPSIVLVVVAVLCFVWGSAVIGQGWVGYAAIGLGIILTVWFLEMQRRVKHPLVDVAALIRHRVLRNALSIQMLLYMNAFSVLFMLSIYIQVSLGYPAKTSGRVLAVGAVIMTITAPLAGRLADRFRPRFISSFGVFFVLVGVLLGVFLDADTGLGFVALILAAHGLGFSLFSTPNLTIIMNGVPAEDASMASALGAKARSLGMVLGMLVTGMLISHKIGNDLVEDHPIQFIEIMSIMFSLLAVLTAIALAVCFLTRTRTASATPP